MVVIPSPDRIITLAKIAAQLTYDLHSSGYSVGEITSIVGSVLGATLSECDPEDRIIFARALMETMQTKLGLEIDQHGRWILRKDAEIKRIHDELFPDGAAAGDPLIARLAEIREAIDAYKKTGGVGWATGEQGMEVSRLLKCSRGKTMCYWNGDYRCVLKGKCGGSPS